MRSRICLGMAVDSDSPGTRALLAAATETEEAIFAASGNPSWHDTLSVSLPSQHRDPPLFASHSHMLRRNKNKAPVKTVPPPKAVTVSGPSLAERIESLQKNALVRKWYFPELDEADMRTWISKTWTPIIGYTPIISRMMKEWYSFHFQKQADLEMVLDKPWVSGRSFLSLTRWYLGFDPLKNTPSHSMIWLKLPNLPLELWTQDTLTLIGNAIGKFIYVDPWIRGEKDKRIAWILIEKPFKGGYPEQIEIIWEGSRICQRIDFWGIPFRCSSCHHTGHLVKDCKYRRQRPHRASKAKETQTISDSDSLSGRLFSFKSSDQLGEHEDSLNRNESPNLADFKSPPLSPPL